MKKLFTNLKEKLNMSTEELIVLILLIIAWMVNFCLSILIFKILIEKHILRWDIIFLNMAISITLSLTQNAVFGNRRKH